MPLPVVRRRCKEEAEVEEGEERGEGRRMIQTREGKGRALAAGGCCSLSPREAKRTRDPASEKNLDISVCFTM